MKNVVFDLGGVVFDWNPDAIIRRVFDDPQLQARIKKEIFEQPDWLDTDRGTLSRADAIVRWSERTGQPADRIDALMHASDASMQPKHGTLALMDELAANNLTLYCLSNMPEERYAYLRREYDFWDQFSGIVISAHIKMVKPEPGIYQHLLTTYDLDPAQTVFVDDSSKNVAAARALGIHGTLFTTADSCRAALKEFGLL